MRFSLALATIVVATQAAKIVITTEEDCRARAKALGLKRGGGGYGFTGSYNMKGCYAYHTGKYGGSAYFSYGGSAAAMGTSESGNKYRVYGIPKAVVADSVNFEAALDAQAAWDTFLSKTAAHDNSANALMTKRDGLVKAWFAAKAISATKGTAASNAKKDVAAKFALRIAATGAASKADAAKGVADTAAAGATTAFKNAGTAASNAKAANLKAVNGATLAASQSKSSNAGLVAKALGVSNGAASAATKASKRAKKAASVMAAATSTYASAKSEAGKRLTEATAATTAMNKSKAAATKAHSDYSAFVMSGHAQGYVH